MSPTVAAIRRGSERTGVDFDYLLRTAQRESALDPAAKARTSSASGLFQFIEQTWLGLVREQGASVGLGDYAKAIAPRGDGRLAVEDAATRDQILALRHDPEAAATLAGVFTKKNAEALGAALGRAPSEGDLYVAHVLGAKGAADLIRGAQSNPDSAAASGFPEAAAANRSIFYDKGGRPRGFGEVYAILAGNMSGEGEAASPQAMPAFATPGFAAAKDTGPALFSLFRTEGRRGPVSEAVARIWNGPRGAMAGAAQPVAPGFFPRSVPTPAAVASATTGEARPAASVAAAAYADSEPRSALPAAMALPPVRGGAAALARSGDAKSMDASRTTSPPAWAPAETAASSAPARRARAPRLPLDLSSFMMWRSS